MMESERKDLPVRIVGGGITGLTLALRLVRRGIPVVLHERDPYLGGLTSESTLGGIPAERFYHCVLPTDTALLRLFEELGMADSVEWNRTRTGFFTDNALLEMTTTADFLRFPALNVMDRARLGWTIAYCGANRSWQKFDREPIGPFLRRHSGERLFRAIWEPLLLAKLGTNYDRFAASFIWATVSRMLSARKAKGRSEKLGFVRGRYGKVFNALRKAIESSGGSVEAGRSVTGLKISADGTKSLMFSEDEAQARGLVFCVPAPVAAQWLSASAPDAAGELKNVDYLGVVCESLLLKQSVSPYYVLNVTDRRLPFTGVIEMSNLAGVKEFGGHNLVYLPRYSAQDAPIWNASDEDVHRENMEGLQRIAPRLQSNDVVDWRIHRARYVQPVQSVGRGKQLPPVVLGDGIAYVSTAQIYPWPVFNDEAIRNVDARLPEVLRALHI